MFLRSIGFHSQFEASFHALEDPSSLPARVVRADGSDARVVSFDAVERRVIVPRRIVAETSLVSGDWVAFDPVGGVVRHVLPRSSAFERRRVGRSEASQVLAANVDVVAIVMALDDDFSPRRVSRYLALAHAGGMSSVIVLTKAAACPDVDAHIDAARAAAIDVPVHAVDVIEGIGLDAVASLVGHGRTLALLGSSGVGKSTLANHLLGRTAAATGDVRARDGKGRHTTTHRELHVVPSGGALIDTPGLRELALTGDGDGLDRAFDDVECVAERCRFRDCRHQGEPGCAVALAVAAGELDGDRVEELTSLRAELGRTHDRLQQRQRRDAGKRASKALRQVLKDKGRR